jgi:alpha-L-fucosidase
MFANQLFKSSTWWMIFTGILLMAQMNCIRNSGSNLPVPPLATTPTPQQLDWQQAEMTLFIHFGINTFYDAEWGEGTEDPARFNPTHLDARQWVQVAKDAGFKFVILTAKHHDGFCLWPSQFTDHSVKNSPWKNGRGDVVREFTDACHKLGVKAGLYLSPWDRHETSYGDSPKYNQYYRNQLTELLTNYGEVAEVWFDGACGEGPNGKRQEYDWPAYYQHIRKLQPNALIAISGPDIRWVGNEDGMARETEWSVQPPNPVFHPGVEQEIWFPAECDVSIRPGWFWHAQQDSLVKSLPHLLDIYFKSVGRNSVLLLNVPPNDQGLFAEPDVRRLREFRAALDEIFATDLAAGKPVTASNFRGKSWAPQHALDANPETSWATEDSVTSGWLEIDLGGSATFNVARVGEPIALGQRVVAYRIETLIDDEWRIIASGTTIGYNKLDRFAAVTAQRVRLVIEISRGCPVIRGLGLYYSPLLEELAGQMNY